MKRALLGLVLAALIGGCGSSTSTTIAPDVKEPDNRGKSGDEILKLKQESEAGH